MTHQGFGIFIRFLTLRSGEAPLRFAQVKEEPAKRAGDTEQNAVALHRLAQWLIMFVCVFSGAAHALQITDDRGVTVTLPAAPQRIVSLLPSLTETVCELGQCHRLVGVDRYSNFPASVQKLPQVGGGLDPNIEMIVALKPDVVLMATSSRAGERLQALGIQVLAMEPKRHADVQRVMLKLGQLLEVPDAARIWRAIDAGVSAAAQSLPASVRNVKVYFEVNQGPYAAGESSFIGETLARLGAKNIVPANLGPFPKLNPEYIVRANPDLIMIGQRSADGLAARPGWQSIRALREQRVCIFPPDEADMLVRPGPRMAEGARLMAKCLSTKAPGAKP
ncbi:iron complex transport system substrate-binding protein [Rhodoferax saidenbachensis]|uniref:Iron complex transport system substrate-binding protein n=2 Tax=Rhodoferax saidenbachensis TaxID=1484693 RepID=A0ABU1ZII1_9BURK|nr:iron complex transport system substrate-binding protein [Rhodoferax saidenbachensis]